MAAIQVQKVMGRTDNEEVVKEFIDWFVSDINKLETTLDEDNPYNGQLLLDYQEKTSSFIVEIQTTMQHFADEVIEKFKEFGFAETLNMGVVKDMEVAATALS